MIEMHDELLSSKELASKLKRSERYVKMMRARGFRMIAGRTTLATALRWLVTCPHPFGKVK